MFDTTSFLNDFFNELTKKGNEISKKHLEQLRGKKINQYPTGFEDAYRKVFGRVSADNVFKIVIGTKAMKAFITEFGSGSLMEGTSENPFLSKYLGMRGYNPTRSRLVSGGNAVLSWGTGQYKTFDWQSTSGVKYITRDGGNRRAGINIESKGGWHRSLYTPRKPNALLRKTIKACREELVNEIKILFVEMINDDKYYYGAAKRLFTINIDWSGYDV